MSALPIYSSDDDRRLSEGQQDNDAMDAMALGIYRKALATCNAPLDPLLAPFNQILRESLDFTLGPDAVDAMRLIARIAKRGDPEAQRFIRDAACVYALHHTEAADYLRGKEYSA